MSEKIKAKLLEMGANPKKALGQNFLVNDSVVEKIIKKVQLLNPDHLIEIGPGLGALTNSLIAMNLPLTLIELDSVFADYWRQYLKTNGSADSQLFEQDALRWQDWHQLKNAEATVLVSNLPYQISSTLLIDRSVFQPYLKGMVLMFQKEVAQRAAARPRNEHYGLLSVIAQSFWNIETVAEAGPKDFYPPPQIASRVLAFQRKASRVQNPEGFLKWVKAGFSHRRKLLKSNLGAIAQNVEDLFTKMGLNLQCRAEELTVEQWIDLWNLYEHSRHL